MRNFVWTHFVPFSLKPPGGVRLYVGIWFIPIFLKLWISIRVIHTYIRADFLYFSILDVMWDENEQKF